MEAIDKQLDLALNNRYDPKVNMTTARYLTDRCLGPPLQRTEGSGPGGGLISVAELVLAMNASETTRHPDA